jgi:restriction endonuclease S subunit
MTDGITLGDVLLDIQSGKSFQTAEVPARADELGVLKVSAVTWSDFRADEAKALKGNYEPAESHKVCRGDLLISRANTKEFVGAVVLVGRDYPFRLLSDKTLRLVIDEKRASKEFLLFALRTPTARKHIEHFATGTSDSMRNISQEVITSIPISLPTLDEQRQVAVRLRLQLAEVETARQAAKAQVRDATLLHDRILESNFASASADHVPSKVLGEWATTTSGSTPARTNKQYWHPADVPWVKTAEVAFARITATKEAISGKALADCSLRLLPPKTVLVAMYGQGKTRGQSAILEIPAATNQACFAILPNETWEPEYLYYWMMASYQHLRELSQDRGGNQANLNGALLKALKIPAPDRPKQREVVQRIEAELTEADAMKAASKATLREIETLSNRLLACAFEN